MYIMEFVRFIIQNILFDFQKLFSFNLFSIKSIDKANFFKQLNFA